MTNEVKALRRRERNRLSSEIKKAEKILKEKIKTNNCFKTCDNLAKEFHSYLLTNIREAEEDGFISENTAWRFIIKADDAMSPNKEDFYELHKNNKSLLKRNKKSKEEKEFIKIIKNYKKKDRTSFREVITGSDYDCMNPDFDLIIKEMKKDYVLNI